MCHIFIKGIPCFLKEPTIFAQSNLIKQQAMVNEVFTPYQMKVISLMAQVQSDEQMAEITDLLTNYFANKAIAEADKLWQAGTIDETTIEQWKHEHMRTPYQ